MFGGNGGGRSAVGNVMETAASAARQAEAAAGVAEDAASRAFTELMDSVAYTRMGLVQRARHLPSEAQLNATVDLAKVGRVVMVREG